MRLNVLGTSVHVRFASPALSWCSGRTAHLGSIDRHPVFLARLTVNRAQLNAPLNLKGISCLIRKIAFAHNQAKSNTTYVRPKTDQLQARVWRRSCVTGVRSGDVFLTDDFDRWFMIQSAGMRYVLRARVDIANFSFSFPLIRGQCLQKLHGFVLLVRKFVNPRCALHAQNTAKGLWEVKKWQICSFLVSRPICYQGRVQGGDRSNLPPLKPTKVTFITMILYNSERHLTANWILTAKYYWNRPPPKLTDWIRLCLLLYLSHANPWKMAHASSLNCVCLTS